MQVIASTTYGDTLDQSCISITYGIFQESWSNLIEIESTIFDSIALLADSTVPNRISFPAFNDLIVPSYG